KDVESILDELGLKGYAEGRILEVWNKIDALDPERLSALQAAANGIASPRRPMLVSALTGQGLDELLARIEATLAAGRICFALDLDVADGEGLAWLHAHTEVLEREALPQGGVHLVVRIDPERSDGFARRFPQAEMIRDADASRRRAS
ncbi:MAG: GTPase HflX, partial [Methylocystis sp.]